MRLGDFVEDNVLAVRAELLAYRLFFGLYGFGTAPETPVGVQQLPYGVQYGIVGVGIWLKQPVLFVDTTLLEEGQLLAASSVTRIGTGLASVSLRDENWSDVLAWGMPDPVEEVSLGDIVRGAMNGTAGAPVEWTASGVTRYGILTAGHVVGTKTTVTDSWGRNVGTIAKCLLASNGGIDVAVVELSSRSPGRQLIGPRPVTSTAKIELLKSGSNVSTSDIVAKAGWFYWKRHKATYQDLYVTHSKISRAGDSGSVAILSGTNEFVGTLVGSSTGSLIQDAKSQLNALSSLSGLTL